MQAYQRAAIAARSPEETGKIWVRLGPDLNDLAPRFVALAERYPDDPAAMDALLWVVEKTTSGGDQGETRTARRSAGRWRFSFETMPAIPGWGRSASS